jgi:hypothetical protein
MLAPQKVRMQFFAMVLAFALYHLNRMTRCAQFKTIAGPLAPTAEIEGTCRLLQGAWQRTLLFILLRCWLRLCLLLSHLEE